MRLLLAYDGSPAAATAIETAAALFPGADAVIATVKHPDPTVEAAAMTRVALSDAMIREGIAHMREENARVAGARVADGDALATVAGLQVTHRIVEGVTPWRALRALAGELAVDLLVCGTHSESAIERLVVGSTASSLLHHADRPLLVVPPATGTDLDGPVFARYDGSEGARRFAESHLRARPIVVAEPNSGRGGWQALLEGAKAAHAAAILVGSRGRGAVAAAVLGSVATGLVHAAERPVIVVPG
jgi:nucleotide-binding universal stress UspA family protein